MPQLESDEAKSASEIEEEEEEFEEHGATEGIIRASGCC